jgi:hypothetical protein
MSSKHVKIVSDALFKRSIIKDNASGNKLFEVTTGSVNIAIPLSASNTYIGGNLEVSGTVSAKKLNITEINTNVIYDTSISASINALLDVSASNAVNNDYLKYRDGYWVPSPLDLAGALDSVKNATNRLKFQVTGSFNELGYAEIKLPLMQLGNNAFPISSFDYIMYDVSIKENGEWIKDLIYSSLVIKDEQLCVILDAPALNNEHEYKLVVLNNNPEDYII